MSVTGLGLFALGGFVNQGIMYAGLLLMLLALAGQGADFWQRVRGMAFFRISAALTGYILISGLLASLSAEAEWRTEILESGADLLLAGGIFAPVVAYWLGGDGRRVRWVLGLGLAGLFFALITGFHWGRLEAVMEGSRDLFGMGNGAALFAATGLAGLMILAASGHLRRWWLELLVLLLVGCLAIVVLWTQTRAVWFALALVLPAVLAVLFIHAWRHGVGRREMVLVVVAAGLLAGAALSASHILDKRLTQDEGGFLKFFSDDIGGQENRILKYRLPLWREALGRIGERPMLGWGSGTSDMLIATSGVKHPFSHYHNLYLQLLVELGAVGFALFLTWIGAALKTAVAGGRGVREAFPVIVFLFAAIALFLLAGLFQIRHDDERGHYFLILFGALAAHRAMFAGSGRIDDRVAGQ